MQKLHTSLIKSPNSNESPASIIIFMETVLQRRYIKIISWEFNFRNEQSGASSRQDSSNYPNQSPLGVTAMVTAIATATATATASVVALQERQEGNNQYQVMKNIPRQSVYAIKKLFFAIMVLNLPKV